MTIELRYDSGVLLTATNLTVSYGAITALQDVSVEIGEGEIVALIGSNGAGKTTLLRAISGLLKPSAGNIQWRPPARPEPTAGGVLEYFTPQLQDMRPDRIVRLGISHVPEGRQVFANLTVGENLMLGAFACPSKEQVKQGLDKCYSMFPVLAERKKQRAGTLSGGEQQMLVIGRALMARPKLLLLDEPSLGLAPLIVKKIFEIIQEINREGTTIFLVEQNARMALTVAHRGYVLQSGRMILADTAAKLLENPQVQRAYLGG